MPYPVSDDYKRHIKQSQTNVVELYVLDQGVRRRITLELLEGNTTEDVNNNIQGQCDLTLVDRTGELVPKKITDLLAPGVNEIQIFKGIMLPNSPKPEMVSMGIYNYTDVDISNNGQSMTIKLQGFDRSKKINDNRFADLWVTPGGMKTTDAIMAIISSRNGSAQFRFPSLDDTTKQANFDRGSNPWEAAKTLAESAGVSLYVDREGYFTLEAVPTAMSTPDWEFDEGEDAVTLTVAKKLTLSEYNHFYEIGEGGDIPVPFMADAGDEESIATTGDRPTFHVSSLYTDVSQCKRAAQAKLEMSRGNVENVGISIIPNAAVVPLDVVKIANEKTGTDSVYILDRVATPLPTGQGQYLTARKRFTNG